MKILHLIDSAGLYGAEKMLLALSSKCRASGHEVAVGTIVSPDDTGDPLGDEAEARHLERRQFLISDGVNWSAPRKLSRYLQTCHADVIHSHGYKANVLLALGPRRARLVCTQHGWGATRTMTPLAFYEALDRRLLWRFDKVVAVSGPIRDRLAKHVPKGRLSLIQNGIEIPDSFRAAGVAAVKSDLGGPFRLLAIGRLSWEKGFDRLIEAARILVRGGSDLTVTIAGEGDARSELEAQIHAANLQEHIELVGYVKDPSVLYQSADCMVICSRTEGLPLVLLEAMGFGVPVIATSVGEIPMVLQEGRYGALLRDHRPSSLATCIESIRTCRSAAIGRAIEAEAYVRERYSANVMALEYCKVYENCLEFRSCRRT